MSSRYSFSNLLVVLIMACILPFGLLTSLVIDDFNTRARNAAKQEFQILARSLAGDVDREIEQAILRLNLIATRLLTSADYASLQDVAERLLLPLGYGIVVHDATGRQVYNARAPHGTTLPLSANPILLAETLAGGKPTISNLINGSFSALQMISVSISLDRNRDLATIALSVLPERFKLLLSQNRLPSTYRWALIDRNNRFVARSHEHEKLVGTDLPTDLVEASPGNEGVGWTDSIEGHQILRAYARSTASHFMIVVAVDSEVVFKPLRDSWVKFGLIGLVMLWLALAGSYLISRRLLQEIRQLSRTAAALGAGKALDRPYQGISEFKEIHMAMVATSDRLLESEQNRQLLIRETLRRARNILAVVQSIVRNSFGANAKEARTRDAILGRISALAAVQDLSRSANWQITEFSEVVKGALYLVPFSRISIQGPSVRIGSSTAQNASLLLHELSTNSLKYGALSKPEGRLLLNWEILPEDMFHLEWRETGGPLVTTPSSTGFGTTVLKACVFDRRYPPKIHYHPDGFVFRMTAPLAALVR